MPRSQELTGISTLYLFSVLASLTVPGVEDRNGISAVALTLLITLTPPVLAGARDSGSGGKAGAEKQLAQDEVAALLGQRNPSSLPTPASTRVPMEGTEWLCARHSMLAKARRGWWPTNSSLCLEL